MNAELSQRQRNLRRLLRPRHVAIVGGQAMADSIRRCADTGFTGEVWVVNPKYPELGGRKCYASIADSAEAPDATFIAVPREATIDILKQLDARGGGGAIFLRGGYTEVGGEGVALHAEFTKAAGNLAVVGPNCYGMLNFIDGICLWPTGAVGPAGRDRLRHRHAERQLSRSTSAATTARCRSPTSSARATKPSSNAADYVEALADDPR
jgi:acyl-CoA synthetase (NDP forming)